MIALPHWAESSAVGDDEIRFTVRLALAWYAVAAVQMLLGKIDSATRWIWTFAWATYLVHLGMAFHYYHHWSHADAVAHTEAVSGFGPGIYFSHLFTLLWTADVIYWWARPKQYEYRARWIGWALHGYMVFIIFNAAVIYESGLIRWAGLVMFTALAVVAILRVNR